MVKATFAKGVSTAVPLIGGVISGGLTLATFKPMASRLKKHLSTLAHMTPEEYSKYESSIIIDDEAVEDVDFTEVTSDEAVPNIWICACGSENKGKFCPECGNAKPDGISQYKCDKCGWEADDKFNPPKFCPECGDPFDDGDIVLV